ncbi:MAG: DUF5683 domain-containing protein [Methylococcaceae bacterium]|nr:DUF5683 domain-containing protein [Prolixibacteraceae bacterium]
MHKKANILPVSAFGLYLLAILFITTGFSALSQEATNDTVIVKKPVVVHSARKATIYSAALPGLGQIYNRKYWKLPLVYGGFATLGYFINFNNGEYIKYRQAYSDIIDNDPNTSSYLKLITNYDSNRQTQYIERLRSYKDYWRRNRDLLVISTAMFYALNIIDASVDAHFFNFDISDDLTMKWAPGPIFCEKEKTLGIQCSITF